MSYILDALKKSEQERKLGGLPDISSEHQLFHKNNDHAWLKYVLIFLLAIFVSSAIFFTYTYLNKNKLSETNVYSNTNLKKQPVLQKAETNDYSSNNAAEVTTDSSITLEESSDIIRPSKERRDDLHKQQTLAQQKDERMKREYQEIFKDETSEAAPVAEQTKEELVDDVAEEAQEESEVEPSWDDFDSIAELSDDIKQQIPAIKVTTHIYSSVESFRKVMVNGYNVSRGTEISEGLIVESIVEEGVIFSFKGIYFRMKALEVWEG